MHWCAMIAVWCSALMFNGICDAPSFDSAVVREHLRQYDELKSQIASESRSLDKKAVSFQSEYILSTDALILPADRDPLDVVLRRTESLINALQPHLSGSRAKKYAARLSEIKTSVQKTVLTKSTVNSAPDTASRTRLYLQAKIIFCIITHFQF